MCSKETLLLTDHAWEIVKEGKVWITKCDLVLIVQKSNIILNVIKKLPQKWLKCVVRNKHLISCIIKIMVLKDKNYG